MKKIAVILSGCGYLDGAEINESVLILLELSRYEGSSVEVQIFAPDIEQSEVINHCSNQRDSATTARNILIESARIARGKINPMTDLDVANFSGIIIAGGYGVAKNLSSIATQGMTNPQILPEFQTIITAFHQMKKPIGAVCISPALIAVILKDHHPILTLGHDGSLLEQIGITNHKCNTNEIVYDAKNLLVSTPAFMHDDKLFNVHAGITKLVEKVLELACN